MADTYNIHIDGVAGKKFSDLPEVTDDIKESDGLIIHRDNGLKRVNGKQVADGVTTIVKDSEVFKDTVKEIISNSDTLKETVREVVSQEGLGDFTNLPKGTENLSENDGVPVWRNGEYEQMTGNQLSDGVTTLIKDSETFKDAIKEVITKTGAGTSGVAAVETKSVLQAAKWTGDAAPYQYDIGADYKDVAVSIGFNATDGTAEQMEAASAAQMQGGAETIIYAFGDKPTVDIPIILRCYVTKDNGTKDSGTTTDPSTDTGSDTGSDSSSDAGTTTGDETTTA